MCTKGRCTGKSVERKKASNGARVEVVVVAGSPSEPNTRSISLDLERRGFIVYIVCNTVEEEVQVLAHNESRKDIKPLMIDITDVSLYPLYKSNTINSSQPESSRASIEALHIPHSISTLGF